MKTSRKKMLLSSIAMLLVALVALGSATYAWYITNATVTAETSTWNASTADGLVIRHGISGDWKSKLTDLHTAQNLTPASITYGAFGSATLYGATGSGTDFDNGELSGALSPATVPQNADGSPATSNQYFLVDTFYVASSTAANKTATFKVIGAQVKGTYLNVAIYVNGTLDKVLTSDPDASTTSKVGGNSTTPETASGDPQTLTPMAGGTGVAMTNITATPKADGQSGAKIDIVAFADGYNTKCKNATANVSPVSLTYSFTVAS